VRAANSRARDHELTAEGIPMLLGTLFRVDSATGCWVYTGKLMRDGYAKLCRNGKSHLAHRYAYTRLVGPIGEGMTLDHLCRNRACANPVHLEPVTLLENVRRARRAGSTHTSDPAEGSTPSATEDPSISIGPNRRGVPEMAVPRRAGRDGSHPDGDAARAGTSGRAA
jgi:hypothetical protein